MGSDFLPMKGEKIFSDENNVGACPARPYGVYKDDGMFGSMFFRIECRVSGEHRRSRLTGEQARPYGCEWQGLRYLYFFRNLQRYHPNSE